MFSLPVTRRKLVTLMILALVVLAAAAAGCQKAPPSGQPGQGKGGGAGTGGNSQPSASEYAITVVKDGKTVKTMNLAAIQAIPKVKVDAAGKTQEGPTLLAFLKAAGVTEFTSVTVTGAWKEVLTIPKDKVNDKVILDMANRGTCKLAGPDINKDSWVRDVTKVEIK